MSKVSSLGHVGISVTDLDKMLDFYTRILGLTVTDGGEGRGVFLSAHPETEHHEFLISPQPDRHTNARTDAPRCDQPLRTTRTPHIVVSVEGGNIGEQR